MIAEIGHFALVLALFVATVQSVVPLYGAWRGDPGMMAMARPSSLALAGLLLLSFLCLMQAFVTSDFSVANVFQNSHSAKPLLYKIAGTWGNHEGSMLLWVLVLALFGAALALFGGNLPATLRARTLAVQAGLLVLFLLFVLLTSNPFERVIPVPLDGRDLNPLLQDPALALHPPMLYLGYVGLSVSFSFAVAALIEGKVDPAWARYVRPWTLAAWLCLTAGIALGSWWAYYELGWGGWWYWDPVENASFMPWLIATALLHSAIVVEKRDTLKSWTILLAILAFALSLVGTFLVRSGVLNSVHAFANDPDRGLFILIILAITIGGALALYAWRAPSLQGGGLFAPVSREGGLLLNNILLATATGTVLLGTLYPMLLSAVTGSEQTVSVGPPYFNATFAPIMTPLVIVMAAGPLLSWKRADLRGVLGRLVFAFVVTVAVVIAVMALASPGGVSTGPGLDAATAAPRLAEAVTSPLAAIGIGLAVWLALGTLTDYADRIRLFRTGLTDSLRRARQLPRASYGMTIAHLGMAVCIAGMVGSTAWKQEHIGVMRPGETITVSSWTLTLNEVTRQPGPNYIADRAHFTVQRDGGPPLQLYPEKRLYPIQNTPTTEAAIHTTGSLDFYLVIGDPTGDGGWVTRVYIEPLVPWIYYGTILMVLGGLVSLSDRRLRIGVPRGASATPTLPARSAHVAAQSAAGD